jgi:hypothetical protein
MFDFRKEIYGRFTPTEAPDDVTLYSITRQQDKIEIFSDYIHFNY